MASDNFNRANANPLDGNWTKPTALGALKLVSNAVEVDTVNTNSAAMSTASSATTSYVTVAGVTGRNGGPAVHLDNSGGGYCLLNYDSGNLYIFRMPEFTQIGFDSGFTYQIGDVLGLRRVGNALVASYNGSDVLTSSDDTTYTGGAPGIFIYNELVLDSWNDGAAGAYTLTADQGTYNINGQAATFLAPYRLTAESGTYNIHGSEALADYVLAAGYGVYNINGQDASLIKSGSNPTLTAEFGTYNITGQSANLLSGRVVAANQGSYTITGQDASFIKTTNYTLTSDFGVYNITGRSANLIYSGASTGGTTKSRKMAITMRIGL